MAKLKNWVSENPKKLKRLLLLFIISLVIIFNGISANASTLSDRLGDPTEFMSENGYDINNYPYYAIVQTDSGNFRYLFSSKPFTYDEINESNYTGKIIIDATESKRYGVIMMSYRDGKFTNFRREAYGVYSEKVVNYTYMIRSNHNIKYRNNSERVFFYASPLSRITYPIIGGRISTQMIVNLTTKEILTILPFLLALVASLLALRKVLVTLFRLLRRV